MSDAMDYEAIAEELGAFVPDFDHRRETFIAILRAHFPEPAENERAIEFDRIWRAITGWMENNPRIFERFSVEKLRNLCEITIDAQPSPPDEFITLRLPKSVWDKAKPAPNAEPGALPQTEIALSNIRAVIWHLRNGEDNAGLNREALALAIESLLPEPKKPE
jgi:hypothetical protein